MGQSSRRGGKLLNSSWFFAALQTAGLPQISGNSVLGLCLRGQEDKAGANLPLTHPGLMEHRLNQSKMKRTFALNKSKLHRTLISRLLLYQYFNPQKSPAVPGSLNRFSI